MGAGTGRDEGQGPAPSRRRGRPPDRRGDETRAAILAAAQRLFGGRGYRGVSMEALAAECGLNPRALYWYFPSKRELFRAATADAFARFAPEVVARVFGRTATRDRVDGYIDVFRHVHESDPHLLPFVGMALVDALADDPRSTQRGGPESDILRGFLETLVDDAIANDELADGVDREGALMLLWAIGMGVALASVGEAGSGFPAMLDVLERLNDGSLYRSP